MKKTTLIKEFDTDNAELIGCFYHNIFGDPTGYSERLYKASGGGYFLLSAGGNLSYTEEHIRQVSTANAQKWIEMHMSHNT